MDFRAGDGVPITPADWEARAAQVHQGLAADGLADSMSEALGSFRFVDQGGRTWSYDGVAWQAWDGSRWVPGAPPPALRLQPFTFEAMPDVPEEPPNGVAPLDESVEPLPTAAEIAEATSVPPSAEGVIAEAMAAGQGWGTPVMPVAGPTVVAPPTTYAPTHIVPASGLPAWSRPDPAVAPDHRLDPGLDVMIAESYPNGWARIVCSNTWTGWVDGRLLTPVADGGTGHPLSPVAPAAPTTPRSDGKRGIGLDLRTETGLVAFLSFAAWLFAVFVAPVELRFAMLHSPIAVGLTLAAVVLAVKTLSGPRAPTGRDAILFVVDATIAVVIQFLFSI